MDNDRGAPPFLIAQLGSGGMADVFLAMRRGPGGFAKLVVLKRLRAATLEVDAAEMFRDEARIAARLNHPNVVQTHAVVADETMERLELEMEFLEGQPLHRIVHRAKKAARQIEVLAATTIIRHVLAGLHHAHELSDYDGSPLGIVHRDVSPPNIFVTYDGQVKVVDFGIAKAAGQSAATAVGVVKGKVRYMAPEQALGKPVDRRADVFAAGIVLWELLTGARYWDGLDEMGIVYKLSDGSPARGPREVAPETPPDLDAICRRALTPNRDDRYASAKEFLDALEASTVDETGGAHQLRSLVCELFAEDRRILRAEVEKGLARAKASDAEADAEPTAILRTSSDAAVAIPIPIPGASVETPALAQAQPAPRRGIRLPTLVAAVAVALLGGVAGARALGLGPGRAAPHSEVGAVRPAMPPPTAAEPPSPEPATTPSATKTTPLPLPSSAVDERPSPPPGHASAGHRAPGPGPAPIRPAVAIDAGTPTAAPADSTPRAPERWLRPPDPGDPWDAGAGP